MSSIYDNSNLISNLKSGQLAVIPTDTVYGLVVSATSPEAVEKLYIAKNRPLNKQPVTIVGSINQLAGLGVELYDKQVYSKYWPGPTSIVHPCSSDKLFHLHRGNKEMAFRLPNDSDLVNFLLEVGPLATSSANIAKQPIATNIEQAKIYFADSVAYYLDYGELENKSSTIIDPRKDSPVVVRE